MGAPDPDGFIRGEARLSIDGKPVRGTATLRVLDVWNGDGKGEAKTYDFSSIRIVRTFTGKISLPNCCPMCNIKARAAWGMIARGQG